MPWIPYFISRTCPSLSTTTRARPTNYFSVCSLSGFPWDRTFFLLIGSFMVRSLLPGLLGAVTMGLYFAGRVPLGLCVAISCVILFLFRLWEYLYEGHSFIFLAFYSSFRFYSTKVFVSHSPLVLQPLCLARPCLW